jgi:hypothetical protein
VRDRQNANWMNTANVGFLCLGENERHFTVVKSDSLSQYAVCNFTWTLSLM